MRLALSHKFVLRSLLVAAAALAFPHVVAASGLVVAPWATAFVALGVGGMLGFFLSRELGRQFERLRSVTDRIRAGDLRADTETRRGHFHDETDELAASIAGMLESLRALVEHVQHGSDRLSSAANELSSSTQQSRAGTEEISATVEGVAKGVEHQQELLEGARRLIHDIAQAIELNAGRAREAFGFSAEANQKAHAGVDVSRLALEKMKTVVQRVEDAGGMVFRLEAKTRHVHQITEMIHSVAGRTNLLSLNASIEAARAGEAGRGFSVVADEIRKLSEATRRSAEEITALVGEIGQESAKVLVSMESGTLEIREGREVIDTVRGSLEGIIHGTIEVADGVREIFTLAAEQARGSGEMVKATDEISRIAEDNAAATEEASAATQELPASLEQMAGSAQELARLADGLRQTASRFSVTSRG